MKISVIMPVYNEMKMIKEILNRVIAVNIDKEILVVDDGSTDGTREILQKITKNPVKLILHSQNRGKGAAIRTALKYVTGDIVIIQDGDLEYDPNDYHALIKPIIEGKTEVVYGSRQLLPHQWSYWRYHFGGMFLTFLANLLYKSKNTDVSSCYKAFSTKVINSVDLTCNKFDFCFEITAKVLRKGYKIEEVPIRYVPRTFEQGKKTRCIDGIMAILTLIKYKILSR